MLYWYRCDSCNSTRTATERVVEELDETAIRMGWEFVYLEDSETGQENLCPECSYTRRKAIYG